MADRDTFELRLVVNRHVGPVVLDDRLGLQHHPLMEGPWWALGALHFVTGEGWTEA